MFEDKSMMKFIYAFLAFVSIFTPGPIFPIGISILAVCLLVHNIKKAKESPDAYLSVMLDIAILVVVIIVNIGIFALRISVEKKFDDGFGSSSSRQEYNINDVVDFVISDFKTNNPNMFGRNAKVNLIKNKFMMYLQDEYDIGGINEDGNNLTCDILDNNVTFTISKFSITYTIN